MLFLVLRGPIQSARVLKPWQDQSSVKGSLPRIERGMYSRRCPTLNVLSRLGASNQAEVPPPLQAPVALKTSGTDVPFAGLLTPESPFELFRRSPSLT
jgi:hypothetical protein